MDITSNVLNSIKNANNAKHATVLVHGSKFTLSLVECLNKAGYVGNYEEKKVKSKSFIEVALIYKGNDPKIEQIIRMSKPSRRLYAGVKELRSVKNGFGSMILSTPKGLMTEKEARKEMVGGEIICKIW